jgi:Ca-activated chloride channel homolog
MSFADPLLLLGLLAVPALLAWYAVGQRNRREAAAAFAAPRMAPSVAPNRPGWRRHAPMAAFLLALVALVVATARPRLTVTVAVQRLTTMLALDMSGSMQATDIAPSRAAAAQRAADTFVTGVPAQVSVGVMQFNQAPLVLQLPTPSDQAALDALGRLRIGGGTAIGYAIEEALGILRPSGNAASTETAAEREQGTAAGPGAGTGSGATAAPGASAKQATAAIVLLSDGKSTGGPDSLAAARRAGRLHVPIFTVALGTPDGRIALRHRNGSGSVSVPVPVETQELAEIARLSGGRAYTATDADHLSAIYRQLGARLGHRSERRDLTGYLTGAGLGLLLFGSALSLGWFGRLI